jgi:hypothetical protein
MKSIAIHQPNYIPWLGYFYKIYQSNLFVFLDDVQFSNQGLHNYHFIKTSAGPARLRIPVIQTLGDKIRDVKVRYTIDWCKKHLDQLYLNYSKAEHFEEVFSDFKQLLDTQYEFLGDLNISIIRFICNKLGIKLDYVKSSDLKIDSVREEKILDICTSLGADIYYSGTGAKAYQKEEEFISKGIQLKYSEYKVFPYPQQFLEFQSDVTIVDFLMNCGYTWDIVLKHQV